MSGPFGSSPWGYNPGGSFYSYSIDQSLRFNDNDSAHLNFTPSSAGSQTTWTWSAWIKRGTLGTKQNIFNPTRGGDGSNESQIFFTTDDQLRIYDSGGTRGNKITTRKFRDLSAWYHIVVALDTTDATAADRVKIYVNGERETEFSTNSNPGLNTTWGWNAAHEHSLGSYNYGADNSFFDGYMAEVNFVDGTALDPTSFGETIGGVWVPKEYSGSYGSNGWYLPFSQDTASGGSAFFDQDDNGYIAWTDPGTQYEIGSSDDFTVEFFFNPTNAEMSGGSNLIGYYRITSPVGYFMVNLNISTRKIYLYHGNGSAYTFSTFSSGDVVAGQWHHIAINRNSGTITCWLDGSQVGSTVNSNTKTFDIPEFRVNKAHATSNTTFDGYISNVRWVVGSAVYANGSTITVPTSTLTNITNTRILACTTTTLTQDASSNNVTGTATSSIAIPFSPFADFKFYDDTSGNTNDWTANNLAASDVVLDSPVNNFATINAAHRHHNMTFKEGNLRHETSTNNRGVVGNFLLPKSGKWYWEHWSKSFNYATDNELHNVGINTPEVDLDASRGGRSTGVSIASNTGNVFNESATGTSYGSGWSENQGVSVLFDADAATISFSENGGAFGSAVSIASGTTNQDWIPFVGMGGGSSTEIGFFNFGQDGTFAGETTSGNYTDANGIGNFKWEPPAGALALCTANLSKPTIGPDSAEQADDYFNTVIYTGDGTSSNAITGVGFQPDWTWIKTRNGTASHALFDSVRGADNVLRSNGTDEENASAISTASFGGLTSFDSDGFTVDDGADGTFDATNGSGDTYVAWNWKAGGTAVSNIDGSITSQVSAAPDAGFSIVSYTGTGANATVGHGLSSAPELIIIKRRDNGSGATSWKTGSEYLSGWTHRIKLNSTDAQAAEADVFNDTAPTSTVFSLGSDVTVNGSSGTLIAYCFHSVEGYSKVGSYVGNGNDDGTFVYTGFRPAFVILKASTVALNWLMYDNARNEYNVIDNTLYPNLGNAEATGVASIDFLSNGFKIKNSGNYINQSGQTFIYLAFAEAPFKYANAR